ncbi:SBBP repeat-containing protein [Myxococcus sp. CA040A]|uniref:SBBP repeat-containing protein n=1 Tax=Myxococcus sp. CA040A TaxID=2741738 RepID=UPI001C2D55A9|nr:SBBP repeat-containing protein [Myxococcus sp. CA040A]NTX08079.1 SBBP repeat-containing protein [Myxococcus sp. CA040A]
MLQSMSLLSLCLLTSLPATPVTPGVTAAPQLESPDSPFSLLPVPPRVPAPPSATKTEDTGPARTMLPEDAPNWLQMRGTSGLDQGTDVAASCEGVYAVGYTTGSFDGSTTAVGSDWFLAKYNLAGAFQWARQHGAPATSANPNPADFAESIATFDVGGRCNDPVIYVAGYTSGNLDGNTNAGSSDAFLTKYDKKGTRIWTRLFGTPTADRATSVATDKNGNIYIVGYSATSSSGTDAFVVKYDAAGTLQWSKPLVSSNNKNDQARGVATDANGDIYVGGHTHGNLGGNNTDSSSLTSDVFMVKLGPTGTQIWAKQFGTTTQDVMEDLATSRRLTGEIDIYLVGYTIGSYAGTNPSAEYDALLLKFRPDGTVQWQQQFGTAGRDMLYGVTSDGGGTVYVTGISNHDIKTGAPLDSGDLAETDVFMRSFSATGAPLKSRQIGSTHPTLPNAEFDIGAGIAVDTGAGVYIVGHTDAAFPTLRATSQGSTDLLVFRYLEGCTITTPGQCHLSYGWGDPHYVTFDGYAYDFQGHGEFILAESTVGDLHIQARQLPWNGSSHVSVFKAVAARLGTERVAYYLGASPPFKINGLAVPITKETPLRDGGRIIPRGSGYVVEWPTGDHLVITPVGSYMNVDVLLSPARRGNVRGPLGNFNGNRADDFVLRDNTPLAAPPSFAQMYVGPQAYVNSWRISQAESLFDYAAGESSSTFTNLNFPLAPPSPTPAQRQQAQQVCQNAGVTQIATLWACITDVFVTNDTSFASGAAAVQTSAQTQGTPPPPQPAPQSVYLVNFEAGAGAGEWSSQLRSTVPAGGRTFLGEFSNETVSLTLPSLPPHTTATVSFDLYVINGWDGNGAFGPSRFRLTASGLPLLLDTTFSNTRSSQSYPGNYPAVNAAGAGAFERNTLLYPMGDSVYRLKYTFNHSATNLTLSFAAADLSGINEEAWGLDNVEIQLQ